MRLKSLFDNVSFIEVLGFVSNDDLNDILSHASVFVPESQRMKFCILSY